MSLFVQSEQLPSKPVVRQVAACRLAPTGMVKRSVWPPERYLSAARKAMVWPSGDQDGTAQPIDPSVRQRISPASPLAIVRVYTSGLGIRQRSSARLEVKA